VNGDGRRECICKCCLFVHCEEKGERERKERGERDGWDERERKRERERERLVKPDHSLIDLAITIIIL
jgi:hypothetical protein